MMNGYSGMWGMGVTGSLFMVLAWVAILALVVWALRALVPGMQGTARPAPLDLLKQRYAAGEIGCSEYEQARRALE